MTLTIVATYQAFDGANLSAAVHSLDTNALLKKSSVDCSRLSTNLDAMNSTLTGFIIR